MSGASCDDGVRVLLWSESERRVLRCNWQIIRVGFGLALMVELVQLWVESSIIGIASLYICLLLVCSVILAVAIPTLFAFAYAAVFSGASCGLAEVDGAYAVSVRGVNGEVVRASVFVDGVFVGKVVFDAGVDACAGGRVCVTGVCKFDVANVRGGGRPRVGVVAVSWFMDVHGMFE